MRETVDVFGADDDVSPIVPGAPLSRGSCQRMRRLICAMRFTRACEDDCRHLPVRTWYRPEQQRTAMASCGTL